MKRKEQFYFSLVKRLKIGNIKLTLSKYTKPIRRNREEEMAGNAKLPFQKPMALPSSRSISGARRGLDKQFDWLGGPRSK